MENNETKETSEHKLYEIDLDFSEFEEKDDTSILEPSANSKITDETIEIIDSMSEKEFDTKYGNDEKASAALGVAVEGKRKTVNENMLSGNSTDDMTNGPVYADKEFGIKAINVNANGKKVQGDSAVALFTSSLGIGNVMHVPLWNSGFWVTLRPPKDDEIINLEIALAENQIELGRMTNTLVYSNYSVVFTRIVVDFIVDHIINTSIKLDAGDDIRDFIRISDLYPLILGIVTAMYPKGYKISKGCINTAILDDDKKPKCNFIATGKIDPKKLLWVNRSELSVSMLDHMANRRPNSVTKTMVENYQSKINANKVSEHKLVSDNDGKEISITLKTPFLGEYIKNGEFWVQNIISKAEQLFTRGDSDVIKNNKVSDILSSVILGIYNIYVTKCEFSGAVVEDRTTINSLIDVMSADETLMTQFIDAIKEHINNDYISIVAIPNYICPKCKADQNEGETGPFKELIPMNMLEDFFDLSAFRVSKIRSKKI